EWSTAPTLFINTGSVSWGVSSGNNVNGANSAGSGGRGFFDYSAWFGFTSSNMVCDGEGIMNAQFGLLLFGPKYCVHTDFGGFTYALNSVIIGGGNYGWRANHGGWCYMDHCYIHGCSSAITVTNGVMAWVHNCDVQFNYGGFTPIWNGSLKCAGGTVKNN